MPVRNDVRAVDAKRLDAFVDSAFAFAVTLLVIAGAAPPVDVEGLREAVARVPAFAGGLTLIMSFWLGHRRFGVLAERRDAVCDGLSLAIVAVVLVYVYPLRLLAESVAHWLSAGMLPGRGLLIEDLRTLYAVYGAGFAVLSLLYAGLFGRVAWRVGNLGIEPWQREAARMAALGWMFAAGVGLLSLAMASVAAVMQAPWLPGAVYGLIPLWLGGRALTRARRRRSGSRSSHHHHGGGGGSAGDGERADGIGDQGS